MVGYKKIWLLWRRNNWEKS
jgi:hypothetical protein